jgi:preprotein translocase subunit SecB
MSDQNVLQIGIAKIYVKDLSFESPMAPNIFRENWRPEIKLDVSVKPRRVQEHLFEVALELTVEAKEGENVGFIVEVEQAGLFEVRAPEGPQLDRVLRVFCPSTLFPYARSVIDQQLVQGGFPPLQLAPVNFENLGRQQA